MSINVMKLVWNTNLTSTEKIVLLYYADRASDDGTGIWPSVATVAECTSLSRRTVQMITKNLISKSYLFRDGWSKAKTKNLRINLHFLYTELGRDLSEKSANDGTNRVQWDRSAGAANSPKPSLTINKPYMSKKKGDDQTYRPIIDEGIKKVLQALEEKNKFHN